MVRRCVLALLVGLSAISFATGQDHRKVVVIDPGHPTSARDFGTKGKKTTEMQVNYRMAYLLEKLLSKQNVKVIVTKPDVKLMLTNKRRAEIANWAHANLFIRLHCDATSGSGYAIYYPGAQGVASDGVKGPSLEVIKASKAAAKLFHTAMAASLGSELVDGGVKTDASTEVGAKQGALSGSIYSESPTLLINLLVLRNDHDETWLLNRKNPIKLAKALDAGVLAALGLSNE